MSLREMENILKDKFEKEQHELDQDMLWNKIKPEIQKKPKRKAFWLWILLGAFGAGLLLTVVYTYTSNTQKQLDSIESSISDLKAEIQKGQSKTSEAFKNDLTTKAPSLVKEENSIKAEMGRPQANNNAVVLDKGIALNEIPFQTISDPILSGELLRSKTNENRFLESNKAQEIRSDRAQFLSLPALSSLKILEMGVLPLTQERMKLNHALTMEEMPQSSNFKRFVNYSILLGYGSSMRMLKDKSGNNEEWLAQRNVTEESLDQWSTELDLNVHVSPHVIFRLGLDYRMTAERFTTRSEEISFVSANPVITDILIKPDGSVENLLGEGTAVKTEATTRRRYNYFHQVGIPIQMVYQFGGQKLKLQLGGGLRINPILFATGNILDADDKEYSLDSDDSSLFGQTFNTDLIFDLGVEVPLSKYLSWRILGQYDYAINGIDAEINPFEQKNNSLKIKTGLTIQF